MNFSNRSHLTCCLTNAYDSLNNKSHWMYRNRFPLRTFHKWCSQHPASPLLFQVLLLCASFLYHSHSHFDVSHFWMIHQNQQNGLQNRWQWECECECARSMHRRLRRKIAERCGFGKPQFVIWVEARRYIHMHNVSCSLICCCALLYQPIWRQEKAKFICLSSVYLFEKETQRPRERVQEKVPRQLSNFSWHSDTNISDAYYNTFSHLIFNSFVCVLFRRFVFSSFI